MNNRRIGPHGYNFFANIWRQLLNGDLGILYMMDDYGNLKLPTVIRRILLTGPVYCSNGGLSRVQDLHICFYGSHAWNEFCIFLACSITRKYIPEMFLISPHKLILRKLICKSERETTKSLTNNTFQNQHCYVLYMVFDASWWIHCLLTGIFQYGRFVLIIRFLFSE